MNAGDTAVWKRRVFGVFFFVPRGFEPGFPRKAASETYLVQMFRYPVLLYKYPEREVVRKYNEYKI